MTSAIREATGTDALRDALRKRRIFYHDIEICDGLRTRFDEDYDEVPYLRRVDEAQCALRDRIHDVAGGDFSDRSVLDAGCADGLFSFHAARCGASRVLGIERNRRNLERARFIRDAAGLSNVELINGPIESASLNGRFDDVFALGLLYHLVDPIGALHRLRQVCGRRLFATVPIDFDTDNAQPLARLDRYQTDGHGFWAFNAAFVRPMFETAGLEIQVEEVTSRHPDTGRAADVFIVAAPMDAGDHHIFDPVIDQEFPPSIERRREAIRRVWPHLAARFTRPVAIFGAGRHTTWMLQEVRDLPGPSVSCILDDRAGHDERMGNLPVRRPRPEDAERFDAILISSWFQHEAIARRCHTLFKDRLPIIALTSGDSPNKA
jgi:SAM-dependent methyltransferase